MWKPIEIKPGDQSSQGKIVKFPKWKDTDAVTIIFVGEHKAFVKHKDGHEDSWDLLNDSDLLYFEPDPPKKLVAPALYFSNDGYWAPTSCYFFSYEDAVKIYGPKSKSIIWPAPKPNSEGFYEVPG